MSTEKTAAVVDSPLPRNPYLPVSLEERAKEKKRIRDEQEHNLARMLDCLDPSTAKNYEDRKPVYEWRVGCRLFRREEGRNPSRMETIDKQVVGQNENEAWARFCDEIGEWPSRRGAKPTISRLKKRTLRDNDEG